MADTVTPDEWTPALWSHSAVMEMQARLDPARMTRFADDWQLAVDRIRDVLTGLNREVGAQLDSSWRGDGARASLDALRRYINGSLAGLTSCRSVAVHLYELSSAAGDLRACISEDLDEALAQVRQLYSTPAVAAANAVEEIPAPPDPVDVSGGLPPGAVPAAVAPTAGSPAAVAPAGFSSAPVDSMPSSALSGHPPYHDPSARPLREPVWHSPTHSAALASLPDTPIARAEPLPTTPSPTASPPNAPSPPPGVSTRAQTSPLTPFVGGMYPGHLGRDGVGEHRAPRYLISAGNASELIGELPLVAPPVIGE